MEKFWSKGMLLLICFSFVGLTRLYGQLSYRQNLTSQIDLSGDWKTIATVDDLSLDTNFLLHPANTKSWKKVQIPHNWDSYEGYRRLLHGNRHGEAAYQKEFRLSPDKKKHHYFLVFEGVGSYATIYLNGKRLGEHSGGRTSFQLDATPYIFTDGTVNRLSVWVRHHSGIKDLPWVCGGCSNERGFSEGSQPMGIFRPVRLEVKEFMRVEPFGVHAWCEPGLTAQKAVINIATTVKNYGTLPGNVYVRNVLIDEKGIERGLAGSQFSLNPGDSVTIEQQGVELHDLRLWNPDSPYLYRIVTTLTLDGKLLDRVETPFGFRSVEWSSSHQLLVNGRPVFLNGVAEYEHLLGASHAFDELQIRSRFKWIKAAGFNALRDAHQPHHMLYGRLCDEQGLLWWSQFSAHVWYDTPSFRKKFKQLLREWVLERRNEPSLILWGLQNESQLPEDFAKECTKLIRALDPTASRERLVTTCNGGAGTDWDVPQNWTGTYGGDPITYATDLKRQILVGEYGAWRSLDLHNEMAQVQNSVPSENRFTELIGTKLALAESVKDSVVGHFFWLLTSHDNPGRVQGGEAFREIDRVGPVNYKGLLTPWEEPTDLFYLFRASYVSPNKEPMVYLVSHTWPSRWMERLPNRKVQVFSNCTEVELLVGEKSYGKIKNPGKGKAFEWQVTEAEVSSLDALGFLDGKLVTKDHLDLFSSKSDRHSTNKNTSAAKNLLKPLPGVKYIYRVNCGGDDLKDSWGNQWSADRALYSRSSTPVKKAVGANRWGSSSWTDEYDQLPAFLASQRNSFDGLNDGPDQELFRSFRFGREKLYYHFPLNDGHYLVDLYFMEPWLGRSGWDAKGMRVFDVCFNGRSVVSSLDLYSRKGFQGVVKKTIGIYVSDGFLDIGFCNIKAGQALIAAISISAQKDDTKAGAPVIAADVLTQGYLWSHNLEEGRIQHLGKQQFRYAVLPSMSYGMDFLQYERMEGSREIAWNVDEETEFYVSMDSGYSKPSMLSGFEKTASSYVLYGIGETNFQRRPMDLYRKILLPGEYLHLDWGSSPNGPTPVWKQPVTKLQPAFDLKPVQSFKASFALPKWGAIIDSFAGRNVILVKDSSALVNWSVKTGVADIYSFTLKYYSPLKDTVPMVVAMKGTGYNRMPEFVLPLTFTKPGKWNLVTFNTPTMINAGEYVLQLKINGGVGIILNGVDLQ